MSLACLQSSQPATRGTRCHHQQVLTDEPRALQASTGHSPGADQSWGADGAKAGVGGAEAGAGAASRATGQITLQEAKQILGIERDVTMEEVLKVCLRAAACNRTTAACCQASQQAMQSCRALLPGLLTMHVVAEVPAHS